MVDIIDNNEIEKFLSPDKDIRTEYLYDVDGKESTNNNIVAKKITINKSSTYYIKYGNGVLLDPHGIDKHRVNTNTYTFVRVRENVFNSYMKYLDTKFQRHLNEARRFHSEGL